MLFAFVSFPIRPGGRSLCTEHCYLIVSCQYSFTEVTFMENSMNWLTNTGKKTSTFYIYTTLYTFTAWFLFNNLEEAIWTMYFFGLCDRVYVSFKEKWGFSHLCSSEMSIDAFRLQSRDVSLLSLTENNMVRNKHVLSRPNWSVLSRFLAGKRKKEKRATKSIYYFFFFFRRETAVLKALSLKVSLGKKSLKMGKTVKNWNIPWENKSHQH